MKEIFTEEEYNEAVKKFNEEMKIDFFSNIENYPTYNGYDNLKEYELSDSDFKLLWRMQEMLYMYDTEKENFSKLSCDMLNQIKQIYFNYFKGNANE